jgi:hypothetical protein
MDDNLPTEPAAIPQPNPKAMTALGMAFADVGRRRGIEIFMESSRNLLAKAAEVNLCDVNQKRGEADE